MTSWVSLDFGKLKGKTIPQIVFADPDWFFWAYEEGVLQKRGGAVAEQADRVYRRATRIRIPVDDTGPRKAEYIIHPGVGKFADLKLVPKSRPPHEGASPVEYLPYIDMSVPRRIARYDKFGCKSLVQSMKYYVFGDERSRLTKRVVEDFFDDDSRFCL